MEQDFLDEMIEESTKRNPEFLSLMEEARQRRALLDALAAIRSRSRISQSSIAKRIKTSQPAIARLEAGTVDPRLSTLQRYAASVGKRIQWTLVDAQLTFIMPNITFMLISSKKVFNASINFVSDNHPHGCFTASTVTPQKMHPLSHVHHLTIRRRSAAPSSTASTTTPKSPSRL